MIIFYLILFFFFMFFRAIWEAELIKRAESKHWPKTVELSITFVIMALFAKYEYQWIKIGISILSFILFHFIAYDYILNAFRKLGWNYKVENFIWDLLATIFIAALFILYYKL